MEDYVLVPLRISEGLGKGKIGKIKSCFFVYIPMGSIVQSSIGAQSVSNIHRIIMPNFALPDGIEESPRTYKLTFHPLTVTSLTVTSVTLIETRSKGAFLRLFVGLSA